MWICAMIIDGKILSVKYISWPSGNAPWYNKETIYDWTQTTEKEPLQ
jgi:hypothetical protein